MKKMYLDLIQKKKKPKNSALVVIFCTFLSIVSIVSMGYLLLKLIERMNIFGKYDDDSLDDEFDDSVIKDYNCSITFSNNDI